MFLLSDIITYLRRIIKTPSNAVITDDLLIDYINRFYITDVDARVQLFDFKTKYQFQTQPGVDKYNMPLYSVQTEPGSQTVGMYPVYQGFIPPVYVNGIQVPFQTQKNSFYNIWPNVVQYYNVVGVGNDTAGPYTLSLPVLPNNTTPLNPPINAIIRGHIDMAGIIAYGNATGLNQDPPIVSNFSTVIPTTSVDSCFFLTSQDATGANVIVQDSGQFLLGNVNCGLLMSPGPAPFGNSALANGYTSTQNVINYVTGVASNVYFPAVIPNGVNINAEYLFFQSGLPRAALFYNNTLTLRSVPDQSYLVELDCYLSPAAFLNTSSAIPFGYMAEYIARGAAQKLLSDVGDWEQYDRYEPIFRTQELLVWKRSQRTWTSSRTETIYSQGINMGQSGFNNSSNNI